MNLTLTISRTSLSLPDLVITNSPFAATFWLPEEGLEEPDGDYRRTYMPDNPDIDGSQMTGAALEHTSIPAVIYTQAATAAELRTNKRTLEAALGQFNFDLTLDLDGAADTYSADICKPRWGAVDSGLLSQRLARGSVTIPVHPVPVAS